MPTIPKIKIDKVVRIGTIPQGGVRASVYCRIKFADGRLSITGVIGPRSSGNALGGCGQIDMEFAHRNPADNDPRYGEPVKTSDFSFAPGWNAPKWYDLLEVWKQYHLNDMQAGCEHQRAIGIKECGTVCPECGYSYGSAWLTVEVPANVLEFLETLPDTDQKPAWV